MLASGVEYDAARSIGEIDTNLVEQRGGRRERRISDRQDIVAYGRMKGPWPWRAALHGAEQRRVCRPARGCRRRHHQRGARGYRQDTDQLPDGRPLDCGRDRTAGHLVDDVEADGDRGAMFQIAFFETDRSEEDTSELQSPMRSSY